MKKFPYMNDKKPNDSNTDTVYYWLQDEAMDIVQIYNFLSNPIKNPPPVVNLKVYQKLFVPCGFPKKKGELTCEECAKNGICGFENFLKDNTYKCYLNLDRS